jgi:hypothetical protein
MLQLSSIPDFVIIVNQFSFIGAIRFESNNATTLPIRKMKNFIEKTTNLDELQINNISLIDALTIVVFYRMTYHDMHPIVENPRIVASDLIRSGAEQKEKLLVIGDYRFTTALTLQMAIESEDTAYQRADSNLLSYYLIANCCKKGFREGWETLVNNKDDELIRGQIIAFNQLLGEQGDIKINLLIPLQQQNKIEYSISLIQSGGVATNAVGFQHSNICTVGI